jgi:hypothetical protein
MSPEPAPAFALSGRVQSVAGLTFFRRQPRAPATPVPISPSKSVAGSGVLRPGTTSLAETPLVLPLPAQVSVPGASLWLKPVTLPGVGRNGSELVPPVLPLVVGLLGTVPVGLLVGPVGWLLPPVLVGTVGQKKAEAGEALARPSVTAVTPAAQTFH